MRSACLATAIRTEKAQTGPSVKSYTYIDKASPLLKTLLKTRPAPLALHIPGTQLACISGAVLNYCS